MVAWMWVYQGGDLWTAVLVAAAAGALFGLLHAAFSVTLGVSQHVTGIGITLLAASLSYFAFRMLLPNVTTPPKIEPFRPYPIPGLSEIPYVGEVLFTQSPLTYLAFALVPRSEEHTSELQSLMRISYAVFCLKKKQQSHN